MLAVLVAVSWALAGLLAVVLVVRGSPDRHAPWWSLTVAANPRWHKANLLDACVCLQRAAVRGALTLKHHTDLAGKNTNFSLVTLHVHMPRWHC